MPVVPYLPEQTVFVVFVARRTCHRCRLASYFPMIQAGRYRYRCRLASHFLVIQAGRCRYRCCWAQRLKHYVVSQSLGCLLPQIPSTVDACQVFCLVAGAQASAAIPV